MPNLVINDYCNLHCKYCFASSTDSNMDLDTIKKIILEYTTFLSSFNAMGAQIGIIGGEPTLHPNFKEILEYCALPEFKNNRFCIFTNGIEFLPFLPYLRPNIGCLININDPKNFTPEQYEKLKKTLEEVKRYEGYYTVGCNVYQDCDDYSFFFDLTKDLGSNFRCSVVAPISEYDKTHMKEYYEKMKPIFLNFLEQVIKNNKVAFMDCNRIPFCYFTPEERKLINSCTNGYNTWKCVPVQDITSNLEIKDCFGRGNISKFNTLDELIEDLKIPKYADNKILDRCKDCGWNYSCQGGCLAFKGE